MIPNNPEFVGPLAHWRVRSSVFGHLVVPPYPPARDPGPRRLYCQELPWPSCCVFFLSWWPSWAYLGTSSLQLPFFYLFLSIFYRFSLIFGTKIHTKINEKNRPKINAKLPSIFVGKMFQRALSVKSGKSISTAKTHIKINIFINQW